MINQNLSKLLECISELERTMNQVGKKQDILISAVQLNSEIYVKGKEIPPALKRQRAEMNFPKFKPNLASFDIEPPNIIPLKAYKRSKGTSNFFPLNTENWERRRVHCIVSSRFYFILFYFLFFILFYFLWI